MMILEEYDPEFHMRKEKELSYEEGLADGEAKMLASNINYCKAIMDKMSCSLEEAMEILRVPTEYRAAILENFTR